MTMYRSLSVLLFAIFTSLFAGNQATPSAASSEAKIGRLVDQISVWRDSISDKVSRSRPFVTVAFAQSIDGKIALFVDEHRNKTTSNLPLSGPESLLLTHGLRSLHDGILVGGFTLSIDNPRLSNRLWTLNKDNLKQPRPIVLDTNLQHLKRVLSTGKLNAQNPIVCCSMSALELQEESYLAHLAKIVTLLPCQVDSTGELNIGDVLHRLRNECFIQSIMVEGGSAVISSFIRSGQIDCLCITIAPKFLGPRGLSTWCFDIGLGSTNLIQEFHHTEAFTLGCDFILVARAPNNED